MTGNTSVYPTRVITTTPRVFGPCVLRPDSDSEILRRQTGGLTGLIQMDGVNGNQARECGKFYYGDVVRASIMLDVGYLDLGAVNFRD